MRVQISQSASQQSQQPANNAAMKNEANYYTVATYIARLACTNDKQISSVWCSRVVVAWLVVGSAYIAWLNGGPQSAYLSSYS